MITKQFIEKQMIQLNEGGEMFVSSLDVAKMMNRKHSELLKDVRKFTVYLDEGNLHSVDFFAESSYLDSKGETRPCFTISKIGCDFLANKMTGKKGAIFTGKYVKAFNEMEACIKKASSHDLPADLNENFKLTINQLEKTVSEMKELYRPTHKQKIHLSNYIKSRLGISTVNDEYKAVMSRYMLILNAGKLQDVPQEVLSSSTKILDECIDVILTSRSNQLMIGGLCDADK